MQLFFDTNRSRWEAQTRYGEPAAELAKASGFKWDSVVKRWHSANALAAMKLRDYADQATQVRLEAAVAAAKAEAETKAKAAEAAIVASRAQDADIEIPVAEGRSFLPYQRAGISYALAHPNVLIADDMGLGKTAQAIGVVNADTSLRKILVICPGSLTRNWIREFGFFGSRDLTIGIATTTKMPSTDIVICTYDLFSRATVASGVILGITWDCLILDEAHYLKNGDAKRTKAILGSRSLFGIRVSKRRLYLTGTPVTNRPIELWPLVHSLAPQEFSNMMAFAKRYCAARRSDFGWDFSGASNLDELQSKLRALLMVRRLKTDVLTELPAKRRQIIELPASTPELKAVLRNEAETEARTEADVAKRRAIVNKVSSDPESQKAAVEALKAALNIQFTEMSAVRHKTAIAKAPVVADHVRDAVEAGSKVIVFAHHADVIAYLCTALADLGVVSITGDTDVAKRQGIVDRFQNDDKIRIFVGNIQAAGVGITLTASSHVVFAELDWVPGNLSQAEDRAHRLGQRSSVLVQHLVLEGSIDSKMAKTVTDKQSTIDAAMDTEEEAEAREARLATAQASKDAVAAAVLADVKAREAQEAEAADHKAQVDAVVEQQKAWLQSSAAEEMEFWRLRNMHAFIEGVAESYAKNGMAPPSPQATIAIHGCLKLLSAADTDKASEANGGGFSKRDSSEGHFLAGLDTLSAAGALAGLGLVQHYRRQLIELDADLVERALGEPVARPVPKAPAAIPVAVSEVLVQPAEVLPDTAIAVVAEVVPPPAEVVQEIAGVPMPSLLGFLASLDLPANDDIEAPAAEKAIKRPRGRPASGGVALSQVERNRRYREARAIVSVDMAGAAAERLRVMRDARGLTTEQLITAALDALAAAEQKAAGLAA